ncbi:hypothetical protein GUJ93_ZPchr0004g39539 [Zizania palustris]|uniref:Uncharacterized protein n=1 Tax=Zizania palustris TaxID=103762 RepID=A0A8J5VG66_ZIZPA|nr:hypothetical protein GUJ93_ZPchr0004g39539 [Zizania palustris]
MASMKSALSSNSMRMFTRVTCHVIRHITFLPPHAATSPSSSSSFFSLPKLFQPATARHRPRTPPPPAVAAPARLRPCCPHAAQPPPHLRPFAPAATAPPPPAPARLHPRRHRAHAPPPPHPRAAVAPAASSPAAPAPARRSPRRA